MKALQLGRYHLLDRIAFGGMAEIYRAKTFDEHGRVQMVAVKRILSHLGRDEEFIRMLVDEARIASLMQHENIAKTYEFCHAHGEYFITMEYVDGKDGRTLLDRCRALRRWIPAELCAFIMMNTLRALHCAHNQRNRDGRPLNLIHRDVSPSNVICSYSGEVKLCDFGIAKATLSRVQTRSGVIKGKVKYMSPEQAMGRKLDLRSDIFSAGSVLYEFLTKVPPFLAPNEMELLVLVRETRYQPVRERNPMVPPALEAIVDTAMSRDLDERYQTAAEFADALEQYLRIHAPRISRSHLGQFVRHLFAEDIERELRALEEYVVEDLGTEEVGVNLLAEDLPPGSVFEKLAATQMPPKAAHREPGDMTPQDIEQGVIEVEAREPPGADPALLQSPTVILESSDLFALQGQNAPSQGETEILWSRDEASPSVSEEPRGARAGEDTGTSETVDPGEGYRYGAIDPHLAAMVLAQEGLHDARTVILDLEDEDAEEPEPRGLTPGEPAGLAGRPSQAAPVGRPSPGPGHSPPADPAGRPYHTLSGTGPRPAPAPRGDRVEDLHDMPTGEIEQTGRSFVGASARPYGAVAPPSQSSQRAPSQGRAGSELTATPPGSPLQPEAGGPGEEVAQGRQAGRTGEVPGLPAGGPQPDLEGGTVELDLADQVGDTDGKGQDSGIDDGDASPAEWRPGESSAPMEGRTPRSPHAQIEPEGTQERERGTDETELPNEARAIAETTEGDPEPS